MPTDMPRLVDRLPRIGMGCMRLSTAPDRDDARAIAVIHAALDAGVRLLDTADAYAHDASEMGHNERLIAQALRSWSGDRPEHRRGDERRHDTSGRVVGHGRPRAPSG